jgi:tetratricopeptide (TPR) repeat protein
MARKKITRKQLLKEPDEFLTMSTRLFRFVMENRVRVGAVMAGLLMLAVAVAGFQYYQFRKGGQAFEELAEARKRYAAAVSDQGEKEAYEAVKGDFETLIDRHGSREAGRLARVALANYAYEAGAPETAISLYEAALPELSHRPGILNLVLGGLAYAHEAAGNLSAAVDYFERITADDNPVMKGEAYYHLGRLYEQLGETGKSRTAYQTLADEYGDSVYADLARDKAAG